MPFNEDQLKAINQRNSSILVSAPAGSGKTRVLVSRIISLLEEGYDITDFLVLTFTEAAGNEMKQRLEKELNRLLIDNPADYEHLNKQLLNLNNAYIMNFHGFCNLLLQKYGYLIDVLPGYTILSDPTPLKKEVLKQCEETWIQNKHYRAFLELYFEGYNFDKFEETLLSLDEESSSYDDFYGFVDKTYEECYQIDNMEEWPLYKNLVSIFYKEAMLAMDKLVELKCYSEEHGILDFYERPDDQSPTKQKQMIPYESLYDYLLERITALSKNITYDSLIRLLNNKPEKSYSINWKGLGVDPEVKDTFTAMRKNVLYSYNDAIKKYLDKSEEEFKDKLEISYQAIETMISRNGLLHEFQQAYDQRKKELNYLDFSDLEKNAHKLLEKQYGVVDKLYDSLKEIMVDEYQDTNQVQESLLLKIANLKEPHIPLFMVGDMKQSIYRFRQADPQIFLNKYNSFSLDDRDTLKSKTKRIDLRYNYRSSKVVLDSINYIFNAIMDKDIGGLDYYLDDSARLNYDYKGKEKDPAAARERFFNDDQLKTEVLLNIYDKDDKYDKQQYEAYMVALKILQLKKELKIEGKAIHYGDIAVLMRTTTAFIDFKKVFDQFNIPSHIVLSQGLMESNEIKSMMSFLKALNDPYDDIALLSVLRVPYRFSYFDMDTIAKVKGCHKERPLYECLKESDDEEIVSFLEVFEELREYSYHHSPYELILKIDELSDYRLFVSQLINGQQRKANLELFYEIIKDTQQDHPYLDDLINTLENSSDWAPGAYGSNEDAVEFMTIHKSKGLEFPIVFVCNLDKHFNKQDTQKKILIDKQLGFAMKPRVYKKVDGIDDVICEYENPYRNIIASNIIDESINEEMRILYVALTRASSKLILTGCINDIEDINKISQEVIMNEDDDMIHPRGGDDVILFEQLRKTDNYLTWILAAILRHPDIIEECKQIPELSHNAYELGRYNFNKLTTSTTEHARFSIEITSDAMLQEKIPRYDNNPQVIHNGLEESYLNYQYPYDLDKPHTLAVTALEKINEERDFDEIESQRSDVKATDKGTLVHLVMSYLEFNHHDNIDQTIDKLYHLKLIDDKDKDILLDYKDYMNNFLESSYYQLASKADYVYQEKKFSYYDEDLKQIIHGIFDLVFVYNHQVYVLDYKTDRVSQHISNESLIERHQVQLSYYKKVLKEMYHQDIQAIIYYFQISKGVEF